MVINMKNEHALVALICVAVAAMTGSASAVPAHAPARDHTPFACRATSPDLNRKL
jgi:hypothetical protein